MKGRHAVIYYNHPRNHSKSWKYMDQGTGVVCHLNTRSEPPFVTKHPLLWFNPHSCVTTLEYLHIMGIYLETILAVVFYKR
ncbi:hypothetical protein ZOSMA_1666G00010 [Zostera marina]|uniref:Uncharacterized protein n=1 Tax=Zostera marina TaxID=29655 RepID=A0A0K9PVU4_ZOSMR|nr:hypothetical protein ZOSMA_1666G00010 [Zostera marina]